MMKRVKLTVAYDGTGYCGFQLQPSLPTIEGELNRALRGLTGEEIAVTGASRTDSGVHAKGNVAVFDTASPIPGDRFFAALNTKLPSDIRVTASEEVPADWHPRKQSCEKTYEYRVDTANVPDPMKRLYSMHWPRRMNIPAMQEAAGYLAGEHDFTSFANPSSQVLREGGSAVRTLYEVSVIPEYREQEEGSTALSDAGKASPAAQNQQELQDAEIKEPPETVTETGLTAMSGTAGEEAVPDDGSGAMPSRPGSIGEAVPDDRTGPDTPAALIIRVRGDGFLYNMVRIIAGTLLDVGTGRFAPEDIRRILEAKDRREAGRTAEARGLTLVKISYR